MRVKTPRDNPHHIAYEARPPDITSEPRHVIWLADGYAAFPILDTGIAAALFAATLTVLALAIWAFVLSGGTP